MFDTESIKQNNTNSISWLRSDSVRGDSVRGGSVRGGSAILQWLELELETHGDCSQTEELFNAVKYNELLIISKFLKFNKRYPLLCKQNYNSKCNKSESLTVALEYFAIRYNYQ